MPYDWGCVFPSVPVFRDDEVRIYYGASDWYFFDWRKGGLALATLDKDRWAGYEAVDDDSKAVVTTVPINLSNRIYISADVQFQGSVNVGILDVNGNKVKGSRTITKSCTDLEISLKEIIEESSNDELRVQFTLSKSKIYSFSIRKR